MVRIRSSSANDCLDSKKQEQNCMELFPKLPQSNKMGSLFSKDCNSCVRYKVDFLASRAHR